MMLYPRGHVRLFGDFFHGINGQMVIMSTRVPFLCTLPSARMSFSNLTTTLIKSHWWQILYLLYQFTCLHACYLYTLFNFTEYCFMQMFSALWNIVSEKWKGLFNCKAASIFFSCWILIDDLRDGRWYSKSTEK